MVANHCAYAACKTGHGALGCGPCAQRQPRGGSARGVRERRLACPPPPDSDETLARGDRGTSVSVERRPTRERPAQCRYTPHPRPGVPPASLHAPRVSEARRARPLTTVHRSCTVVRPARRRERARAAAPRRERRVPRGRQGDRPAACAAAQRHAPVTPAQPRARPAPTTPAAGLLHRRPVTQRRSRGAAGVQRLARTQDTARSKPRAARRTRRRTAGSGTWQTSILSGVKSATRRPGKDPDRRAAVAPAQARQGPDLSVAAAAQTRSLADRCLRAFPLYSKALTPLLWLYSASDCALIPSREARKHSAPDQRGARQERRGGEQRLGARGREAASWASARGDAASGAAPPRGHRAGRRAALPTLTTIYSDETWPIRVYCRLG